MSSHKPTIKTFFTEAPLTLDSGAKLGPINVAYETYGTLNADKSNAILLCHSMTGDQYAASPHPITGKPGWWDRLTGPGKLINTDKYFVICSNVLTGCMGTSGPASINPDTGRVWGLDFPRVTVRDMVRVQKALINSFGIETLFSIIGGSMGGMQVLEWLATYPDSLFSAIPIATASRQTAQNIAFHEVGRQAIMADPSWQSGRYEKEINPAKGLSVARMTAHITYLSEEALTRKFGRRLQDRDTLAFGFDADFQVESYLRHQGSRFVERFDANSYLYITRAIDYFDLTARSDGPLSQIFKRAAHVRTAVLSFTSDWLYPASEARLIVRAMSAAGLPVSFTEITSSAGHDAFLLYEPQMDDLLAHFLDNAARERGLIPAAPAPPAFSAQSKQPDGTFERRTPKKLRPDQLKLAHLVPRGSKILEIGCAEGTLLAHLKAEKAADPRGIELSQSRVNDCVSKGLCVIQGDADSDLTDYPDDAFDLVILSKTLQTVKHLDSVLTEVARIGRRLLISIENFGYWRTRGFLFTRGRMPVTQNLDKVWYTTDNIHVSTLTDMQDLIARKGLTLHAVHALTPSGRALPFPTILTNWRAETAILEISRS